MNPIIAFRSDDNQRAALNALFADPIMAHALFALRDNASTDDVQEKNADAIASVRILSRRAGYHQALNDLISLTQPIPGSPAQFEEETYGVEPPQPEQP